MLLLDKDSVAIDSVRKIIVLSEREELRMEVAQMLRTRGLENVEVVDDNIFITHDIAFSEEETLGVIADIGNETNVHVITDCIHSVIPQNVWCCVLGESDSISLSQKLLDEGVLYFNSDSQLGQMVEKVLSGVNIPLVRHTIKISILGCKGGIGSSLISSHIANNIVTNKKVPVLLAQGSNGSQDLDLLFDKKIQNDVVEYNEYLGLYKGQPGNLPNAVTNKYNFIIYDQPIFNVNKEDFSKYIEQSNNFVLVVERRIGSLRVAKQFLDECERVRSTTGKPIRTFICLSDNKLETSKLMVKTDIENLIKTQVDAVIPFLKHTDSNKVISIDLGKNGQEEIESLSMKVIGMVSRNKKSKKNNKGFFAALFGRK
ncbi:pilus assembly protein [Glaesserella sp.]|uniref:pilus assembly protein n=1 Tax=Glaesserella sp. TaxID=2094731 RepID=UPI0035A138DF